MTKLEVYDLAVCCSTGICDPALAVFAADVKWAANQGVTVRRYNLTHDRQAFAANPAILDELEAGIERLPIMVIDGKIVSTGVYLSRDQLEQKLGLAAGEDSAN